MFTVNQLPERIQIKIEMNDEGCWTWTASTDRYGYGKIKFNCVLQKAHRVVWKLLCGCIPRKNVLDHTCRNRSCVNPAHLEPVTNLVNVRRGVKARSANEKALSFV